MDLPLEEYQALSEFRFQIRRFLHFSEEAAKAECLEPQQHQFLLTVRADADPSGPTIGKIADQLMIRHHSAVGLTDRLTDRGLVERARGGPDLRQVHIRLTPDGSERLGRLSQVHRDQLRSSGTALVATLQALLESVR